MLLRRVAESQTRFAVLLSQLVESRSKLAESHRRIAESQSRVAVLLSQFKESRSKLAVPRRRVAVKLNRPGPLRRDPGTLRDRVLSPVTYLQKIGDVHPQVLKQVLASEPHCTMQVGGFDNPPAASRTLASARYRNVFRLSSSFFWGLFVMGWSLLD